MSQQRKKEDGTFSNDIEAKVEEMERKKSTRTCPNCHTEMPKQKRKCVNPECRVDLKAAEEKLTGEDILGTALVAPLKQYNYRCKENEIVIDANDVEGEQCLTQQKVTRYEQFHIEWTEVKSGHPLHPVTISVSDPVFVNPASHKAVAEVLRHVGKVAEVTRYGFTGETSKQWLPVTMDGAPYCIDSKLIEYTYLS